MENNPLVSVVLCTYNNERTIAEAILSVLKQTFTDFELIIWNDGSVDNTEKVVKEFSDPRIKYFYHENTGIGRASNLACQKARGKYIAKMDGDDICMLNRLQKEVDYMENHSSCVLLSSAVLYMNEDGEVYSRSFPYTKDGVLRKKLKTGNPFVNPASMFRKDVYDKTQGYRDIKAMEDFLLFKELSEYGKVINLSDILLKYRIVSNSLTHRLSNSPYRDVITAFNAKIARDNGTNLSDIELYNQLYKQILKEEQGKTPVFVDSRESFFYNAFYRILGENNSVKIISFIKNIYGFVS